MAQSQQQQQYDVLESPRSTSYNFAPPVPFLGSFPRGKSFFSEVTSPTRKLPLPSVLKFIIPKRIVTPATPDLTASPEVRVLPPSPLIPDAGTGLGILAEPSSQTPASPYPAYDESFLSPSQIPDHARHPRLRKKVQPSAIPWRRDVVDAPTIRIDLSRAGVATTAKETDPGLWVGEIETFEVAGGKGVDDRDRLECPSSPSLRVWVDDIYGETETDDDKLGSPIPKPLGTSGLWSTYESPPLASPSIFPVGPAVLGIADYAFPVISAATAIPSLSATSPSSTDSPGSEGSPFPGFDSPRTIRPSALPPSLPASLRLRRTSSDTSVLSARMAALQARRGSQTEKLKSIKVFAPAGRRKSGLATEAEIGLEDEETVCSPDTPIMSPFTPAEVLEGAGTYFAAKKVSLAGSPIRQPPPMLAVITRPAAAPLMSPHPGTPPVMPSSRSSSPFPAPSITVFRPPGATALAATALAKPLPASPAAAQGFVRPALRKQGSSTSIQSASHSTSRLQSYSQPNAGVIVPVKPKAPRSATTAAVAHSRRSSVEHRRKMVAAARSGADIRREARRISVELRKMSLTEPDPQASADMRRGSFVLDNLSSSRRGSRDYTGASATGRRSSIDRVFVASTGARRTSIDRNAMRRTSIDRDSLRQGSIERNAIRRASIEHTLLGSVDAIVESRRAVVNRTSGRRASVDRVIAMSADRRRSSVEARRRAEATIAALAGAQARAEAEFKALQESPKIYSSPGLAYTHTSPVSPSTSSSDGKPPRRLSGPTKERRRTSQILAVAKESASASTSGKSFTGQPAIRRPASPPPPKPERYAIPPVPARAASPPPPTVPERKGLSGSTALDLLIGEVEREIGREQARAKRKLRQARLAHFFGAMRGYAAEGSR